MVCWFCRFSIVEETYRQRWRSWMSRWSLFRGGLPEALLLFVVGRGAPSTTVPLGALGVLTWSRLDEWFVTTWPLAGGFTATLDVLMMMAVERTIFGLLSSALIFRRTTRSMSWPLSSSEPMTIFWLYNGCGRFKVLLGNVSFFAWFVVVEVEVWVALACESFSSTAKEQKRNNTNDNV